MARKKRAQHCSFIVTGAAVMSQTQYWWLDSTTLMLLLGLNLTCNYCPSTTKGPMLYVSLYVYLYKLYVYNLCHVHSAIHVSLSVIQQSATQSGNNSTVRCDQQLTEQLDHHICITCLETNWTADEFQNSLVANRGDKSRWRKAKFVVGGEDSRVTGSAAWPPNSILTGSKKTFETNLRRSWSLSLGQRITV